MQLSNQQKGAIDFVLQNLDKGVCAIDGPAGSGKTTTVREIVEALVELFGKGKVIVSATTGKAAQVLRKKGIKAITLHKACMRPIFKSPLDVISHLLEQAEVVDDNDAIAIPDELIGEEENQYSRAKLYRAFDKTRANGVCPGLRELGIADPFKYLEGWLAKKAVPDTVLIVDEASMLGDKEFKMACEVFGMVVLVGDTYQLEPVKSSPVFWTIPYTYKLTEIHRQAAGAQPLELATAIRKGETVSPRPIEKADPELCRIGVPIIVWRNSTRMELVNIIRTKLGYDKLGPQPGETLVCRNGSDRKAQDRGLVNNTLWTVMESNGYVCTLQDDQGNVLHDEHVHIEEHNKGLGVPFRFAYALTCHNAQGSEWENVMIHVNDARACFNRDKPAGRKWLYTALTRAKSKITWIDKVA